MASRKANFYAAQDTDFCLVYTTTHPPYMVPCSSVERQRSAEHIRRLPPAVFRGRGKGCRPLTSSSCIPSYRKCDILRLIVDEEGSKEVEMHSGQHLPRIHEEEEEEESMGVDLLPDDGEDGDVAGGSEDTRPESQRRMASKWPVSAQTDLEIQSLAMGEGNTNHMNSERIESRDDEFDTDLSDPEEIYESSKKKKRKKETLQIYKIACVKYKLAPRSAFVKQCGQVNIDLSNRLNSAEDLRPISLALMGDKDTRVLDLSSNSLGAAGASDLGHMLSKNQTITDLNLSSTELGRDGLKALDTSLVKNSTLTILRLASNHLQWMDDQLLAILLRRNQSLVSVDLSWNGLGSEGCVGLTKLLAKNKTLRKLDISSARLCAQDVEMLTKGLWNNSTLECLKISSNPITTVGAKSLAKAVLRSKSSAMRELDLSAIPVDDDFVFMANLLDEHNSTRVIYDLTGNLLPLMDVNVAPWPKEGPDLGFYKPVTVLFEYMKMDGMRIIDLFEFLDHQKRGKISMGDLRRGIHVRRVCLYNAANTLCPVRNQTSNGKNRATVI
ncbi:leucine-rich repeat-containing protein 74B-like [Elysia marginata]|uniref:Leucine-rich repeat-containing protein 74B-like n=1 Tax=Elysia marginata TaxID=1093978 RepID=A0AAV4JMI2_9GAST|nr:leucine-rich repeat-containing protein 74B-like [Elysia marginata]